MNEQELFLSALEIDDPAARQAHLQTVCADDPELLARVESLLASHEGQSQFLNTPVVDQMVDEPVNEADATLLFQNGSTQDDEFESADFNPTEDEAMTQHLDDLSDEVPLGYLEPSSRDDSLGRLGHYEILEVIGSGAFGTVLKAFDEKLHRIVAIKVLAPQMAATSPARKRFLREARSSAAVRHENVVSIYAVEDEPTPYLVMEYIPGETLQQRLDGHGPLDLVDVLRMGKQIADGLAAAHAQDLIHRDIKPGNIMLESSIDDHVKITDFGLARAADDASMTQSGMIAGTPLYMAPEQAQGQKLDQRADLFSFGSVLYQMLSGRPPFRAPNTVAVLKRVVDDTPRPIKEIISEVPDWMCELIGHLHAKNPDERYSSAKEVSVLLDQCIADVQEGRQPMVPAPASAETMLRPALSNQSRSSARSSKKPVAKVAAVALVLLVALGFTEATGLTELAPTVVRLLTGAGTLVIEIDDPTATVAINGEVVTIRGGGVDQLTLRPGEYKVSASKDGQTIQQELVKITRNGRTTVRMILESDASIVASAVVSSTGANTGEKKAVRTPPVAKAPFDEKQAKQHQKAWAEHLGVPVEKEIILGKDHKGEDLKLTMVLIPPGEFLMGTNGRVISDLVEEAETKNPDARPFLLKMEGPQHLVKITNPFWLSKYEFKTGLFRRFVESTGYKTTAETDGVGGARVVDGKPVRDPDVYWDMLKGTRGDFGPVVNVSHNDALACCAWLSKQHPEMAFSLPTEAQWEFACRAGTTTPWHGCKTAEELEQYAWFDSNAKWIQGGGRLKPNAFGLYDMHGNVWEWCLDWMSGIYGESPSIDPVRLEDVEHPLRVNRGGSFMNPANTLRSAKRGATPPDNSFFDRGFRVAAAITDGESSQTLKPLAQQFASSEWIDMIPLIDPEIDPRGVGQLTGRNEWRIENGELLVGFADDKASKLVFPLDADWAAFEFDLELTRKTGQTGFSINIPTARRDCPLIFEWPNRAGLMIGDLRQPETILEESLFETGRKTSLRFIVRRGDPDQVTLWRDDEQVAEWTGDCLKHALNLNEGYPQQRQSSIFAGGRSEFVFHRFRVRMLDSCKATTLRPVLTGQVSRTAADAPPLAIAPFDAEQAKQHQQAWADYLGVSVEKEVVIGQDFRGSDVKLTMVLIPPGEFLMGSSENERAPSTSSEIERTFLRLGGNEHPQHRVRISRPFRLSRHEVTIGQFRQFVSQSGYKTDAERDGKGGYGLVDGQMVMGPQFVWSSDRGFPWQGPRTENYPVANLSWNDAAKFCEWLSQQSDRLAFTLPTEAQWEYACRAGTTTKWHFGDSEAELGNYRAEFGAAVGKSKPNAFGLFDMHGNVWEWCADVTSKDYYSTSPPDAPTGLSSGDRHVQRGGAVLTPATTTRSAYRILKQATHRHCESGFRVAAAISDDVLRATLPAASDDDAQ